MANLTIKDSNIFAAYLKPTGKIDRSKIMKAAHSIARSWKEGKFASVIGTGGRSLRRAKTYAALLSIAMKMIYSSIKNPFDLGVRKTYSEISSRRLQRCRMTD